MVVVKIELWPHGDQARKTTLGQIHIINDGTGDAGNGNYDVQLKHSGRYAARPGNWKTGHVSGFLRQMSPYHLLVMALNACGIHSPD